LASVSLPLPRPSAQPMQFDPTKQAWIISSANPNLRIAGQFRAQLQPGIVGVGFAVAVSASFMQIALYRGRYLLRDGYHRAYGFLSRNVVRVPVFWREFATFDELRLPAGLLPQDAYLRERPPLLIDYSSNDVSMDIQAPALQKMVVIQGLELTTLG
jgi:hypothetical protein